MRGEARRIRGAPVRDERILVIGDGMFTDILGARRENLDSILITSGIHRDRIRVTGPDGRFTVEPAAYAELAREAGAVPTGHMHVAGMVTGAAQAARETKTASIFDFSVAALKGFTI